MVNFIKLQKEFQDYDNERERLIKKSRDILKLSKQIIYAVHRNEINNAKKLVDEIEKERKELEKISQHSHKMVYEGSYKIAIQEYVEAILYYNFVITGKLAEINVLAEHYILGLCDLPGELSRKAVFLAGKGQTNEVIKIKDLIDLIYGELLKFDFRDNEIRRKVDAVKYELIKLENLVFEMKLKEKL
jgi:translin